MKANINFAANYMRNDYFVTNNELKIFCLKINANSI